MYIFLYIYIIYIFIYLIYFIYFTYFAYFVYFVLYIYIYIYIYMYICFLVRGAMCCVLWVVCCSHGESKWAYESDRFGPKSIEHRLNIYEHLGAPRSRLVPARPPGSFLRLIGRKRLSKGNLVGNPRIHTYIKYIKYIKNIKYIRYIKYILNIQFYIPFLFFVDVLGIFGITPPHPRRQCQSSLRVKQYGNKHVFGVFTF